MKDFLFFRSEKEKKSFDRFLKKKSQRSQIFIISMTTSYLVIDSLIYLVSWLLEAKDHDQRTDIIIVELLQILGFSLSLLLYYLIKRFIIMKMKSRMVISLDFLMFFLKLAYLIIYMEGEQSLMPTITTIDLTFEHIQFFLNTTGLKIAIIETSFLLNYFRWPTKILSLIATTVYLTFRVMHQVNAQILSLFTYSVFIIIIVLKIEKETRRFFIAQENQGKFFSSSDKFKYIFENLNEKIIEKFFNKSSEGFLFIDKDFHSYHHNDKISNFFHSSANLNVDFANLPKPTSQKYPLVANQRDSRTGTVAFEKTSEDTIKKEAKTKHFSNFSPGSEKTALPQRSSVEQFLSSKLISLKEGPEFLSKFFQDSNLKILNKTSSTSQKKCVFQSNASMDNVCSVNLIQKHTNAISLLTLCQQFLKKMNKTKEKSHLSSFHMLQTMKFTSSNTNNLIQEEDFHALVEISFLYFDDKKQSYREKAFEVMIFPIFKASEITHFFFLVQDLGLETTIKSLTLESQNKSKALAFVSHEMRTPLNCTKGMLQMIKDVISAEYLNAYVMPALTSSEFLLNLLNDLLDISQIQNGRFRLVYLEFSLRTLLTDILILFKFLAESKGINIFFTCDDKIPETIKSDANRIRQIVTNLMGNAMKFTQKGSITLHASLESKDNTLILIQVIDTGVGIKDQNKENLFQAFGKVDSDENEYLNSQGVGLGLLISNILAKNLGPPLAKLKKFNMNAGLNMTSKYGDGTTFKFLIEDKNETDLISKGTRTLNQIPPENEMKLIDYLNHHNHHHERNGGSREESIEKEGSHNFPFRTVSLDTMKRGRKSPSFVPLSCMKEESRISSVNIIEKRHYVNYKTLLVNEIQDPFLDLHFETDEEFLKKNLVPCENNCPRILICDDDYFNLVVLENFLQELKVKLEKAVNGFEAVEKVKNLSKSGKCCKTFKLIFMDIEMPEKNGFEAAKEIITNMQGIEEECPPIIATTGHTEHEEIMKIKESGMKESIPKPISKKDMMKMMRKVLGSTGSN